MWINFLLTYWYLSLISFGRFIWKKKTKTKMCYFLFSGGKWGATSIGLVIIAYSIDIHLLFKKNSQLCSFNLILTPVSNQGMCATRDQISAFIDVLNWHIIGNLYLHVVVDFTKSTVNVIIGICTPLHIPVTFIISNVGMVVKALNDNDL